MTEAQEALLARVTNCLLGIEPQFYDAMFDLGKQYAVAARVTLPCGCKLQRASATLNTFSSPEEKYTFYDKACARLRASLEDAIKAHDPCPEIR